METYFLHYKDGVITIQPKVYIEDGWYIEIINGVTKLFEIPKNGGNANLIGLFKTLESAIKAANKLT